MRGHRVTSWVFGFIFLVGVLAVAGTSSAAASSPCPVQGTHCNPNPQPSPTPTGPPAGGGGGPVARVFPTAPYAYKVCTGPNPDGTVSETQVDTCQIFLTGGGGPFFVGDHLTIAAASPFGQNDVTSCAASSIDTVVIATTNNLCDFTFTSRISGAGVFVGTEQILIPSTISPGTPVHQVAFYCSVIAPNVTRFCPDVAVPINVTGPGATVIDEIPPTFTFVPADMTVDATGPTDTVVTYPAPTAVDNAPGTVAISCTPASGSGFVVGTTVVTCTATDASGNVATATFDVTAQNTFDSLCRVTRLEVTNEGVAHSLCVKLEGAEDAAARGDSQAADGKLGAFTNEVEAQRGKTLTAQQAQDLEGLAALLL